MNIKDFMESIKWYVDPINGSDSNDGKSWDAPFKTITKALEYAQGVVIIDWSGGIPSWISYVSFAERMPCTVAASLGFKIKWRNPSDGFIYFSLASDASLATPFALEDLPGPEVAIPYGSGKDVWLYDGLISNIPHREFPNFGLKLYIDTTNVGAITDVLGNGDGFNPTFSGTMQHPIIPGTVVPSDGVETFSDDGLGVLTGSLGGNGTANYVNGDISITFNTAPGMGIPVSVNYVLSEGEQMFTTECSYDSCNFNARSRHSINIAGGFVQEILPTIRGNIEFNGVGISFGNVFIYLFLGLFHSETTISVPMMSDSECLLPPITIYGGVFSTDGCNVGFVVSLGDGAELVNDVHVGDTQIEVSSFSDIGFVGVAGGILKIGHSSAPAELIKTETEADPLSWDYSDDPELRESTPGGGYDLIVLRDFGNVYNKWVGTYGLSSGKMTLSLILTGFDLVYTNLEKINEDGNDKSKFTLSEPMPDALIQFGNFISGFGGLGFSFSGVNNILPLTRPIVEDWPAGTAVNVWMPAAISDLFGTKLEFNETALCSSTAGIVTPAYLGLSSIPDMMTGLWEINWTGRNIFFLNGKGTPAFLNYSFLPKRKKFNQTYFMMLGDCHIFDFPPYEMSLPWYTSPMHFVKPLLDQLSVVANSTIVWLNSGSTDNLIRQRGDQKYDVWFGQNAYAKTVGKIGDWLKDFILGTASPDTMQFNMFEKQLSYPSNSNHKDEKPMSHVDEFIVSTITSKVAGSLDFDIVNSLSKVTVVPDPNPRKLFVGALDYSEEKWYMKGHSGDPTYLVRTTRKEMAYDDNRNLITDSEGTA